MKPVAQVNLAILWGEGKIFSPNQSKKVTVQGIVKQPAALTLWKSSPGAGEREKHCPS
jgi:hypothetical protein